MIASGDLQERGRFPVSEMNIDKLQAGRELDALVAERIMGWILSNDNTEWHSKAKGREAYAVGIGNYPRYAPSAFIYDAWKVVSKVRKLKNAAFSLDCLSPTDDYWQAMFKSGLDLEQARFNRLDYAFADTPELAICRAALKVVMHE